MKALGPQIASVVRFECKKMSNPAILKDLTVFPERCLLNKNGFNYLKAFREFFAFRSIMSGELNIRLHLENNIKALLYVIDTPSIDNLVYSFWNLKIEPKI